MLASIFSLNVLQTALELGCIYGLVALALFLSYSILNIADLSTDGCFTLGCAVACQVALTGHPILALAAAMAAGVCSGFVTAFLQTRLGVESIMAGIIVNTGLYTINLAVMGFSSTMSLVKTDTVFSLAKSALDGRLAKRIGKIQTALQTLNAHLTAWVDYPEEDVPELSDAAFVGTLTEQKAALDALISGYSAGAVLRHGVDCVLLGRPNVGKSTLLNLLAGFDRAIVTPVAGTTRDIVEQAVQLGSVRLNLFDTAGVREVGEDGDAIEAEGIRRSWRKLDEAGLVLAVFDAAQPLSDDDLELARRCQGRPAIAVLNKQDLAGETDVPRGTLEPYFKKIVPMCARDAVGLQALTDAVADLLGTAQLDPEAAQLCSARQLAAATRARDALAEAIAARQNGFGLDAAAVCLTDALQALFDLTGENASDATIEEVFETFCVGK